MYWLAFLAGRREQKRGVQRLGVRVQRSADGQVERTVSTFPTFAVPHVDFVRLGNNSASTLMLIAFDIRTMQSTQRAQSQPRIRQYGQHRMR